MPQTATILLGDVSDRLRDIEDRSVQSAITSPPYWGLRDYRQEGQIGHERTPDEYVARLVEIFREIRRTLADDGTLWLNLGDSYIGGSRGLAPAGLKPKDLAGIPWRTALALQADGWWLRQDIIWHKPNPMPEAVSDRTTRSHEYLFLLTKSARYHYDADVLREPTVARGKTWKERKEAGFSSKGKNPTTDAIQAGLSIPSFAPNPAGRNRRSVWTINSKPFRGAHFAVMPEALVEPPILATSRPGDLVLDPFLGSGTVAVVALRHGRNFVGCDLNADYIRIAEARIADQAPDARTLIR